MIVKVVAKGAIAGLLGLGSDNIWVHPRVCVFQEIRPYIEINTGERHLRFATINGKGWSRFNNAPIDQVFLILFRLARDGVLRWHQYWLRGL